MSRSHRLALITGGASGLGYEFARLLAADRYHLLLIGRDQKKLALAKNQLIKDYQVEVKTITADLSEADGVANFINQNQADVEQIEILINNAGVGMVGRFAELNQIKQQAMLQLNVNALTELTQWVLPQMIKRGSGKILNIASTAAFQPGPLMAVYYASKAYVLSLSEALWEETRGTGVTVTALAPGPTKTGFQDRAALAESLLFRRQLADAATVARIGYQALQEGKRLSIPGFGSWLGAWLVQFLPRSLLLRGVRRLHSS